MNARAYYNEFNPAKAEWLRELIAAGVIAPGHVDSRSIRDIQPRDLDGFTQCHFFAGIGAWSYALRLAGWPDDRPVWTGSCPCQPFSAAGKRQGQADERHLWPELHRLVSERRPVTLYCEQVASGDGLGWLDLVLAQLEDSGYAAGAVDLCAAGLGGPHIRQRLGIVAHAAGERQDGWRPGAAGNEPGAQQRSERLCAAGGMGEPHESGREPRIAAAATTGYGRPAIAAGDDGLVGDAGRQGFQIRPKLDDGRGIVRDEGAATSAPSFVNGHWAGAELIPCTDGKWRPIEPGLEPLADGPSSGLVRVRDASSLDPAQEARETFPLIRKARARTLRLRGYGDAIVVPQFVEFIKATMGGF